MYAPHFGVNQVDDNCQLDGPNISAVVTVFVSTVLSALLRGVYRAMTIQPSI